MINTSAAANSDGIGKHENNKAIRLIVHCFTWQMRVHLLFVQLDVTTAKLVQQIDRVRTIRASRARGFPVQDD